MHEDEAFESYLRRFKPPEPPADLLARARTQHRTRMRQRSYACACGVAALFIVVLRVMQPSPSERLASSLAEVTPPEQSAQSLLSYHALSRAYSLGGQEGLDAFLERADAHLVPVDPREYT